MLIAPQERRFGGRRALALALIAGHILFTGSKLALFRQPGPDTATSTLGEERGLGDVDEHVLSKAESPKHSSSAFLSEILTE